MEPVPPPQRDQPAQRGGRAAGGVSADTIALVKPFSRRVRRSDGLFDPTVHAAVVDSVTTATWRWCRPDRAVPLTLTGPAPGCAGIEIDRVMSTVELPPGVAIDPGGIGKGLAADLVATELLDAGAAGCLVNVGGDLRAAGSRRPQAGWVVTVPDPLHPGAELLRLALDPRWRGHEQPLERRWRVAGVEVHHLIDPFTGGPVNGNIAVATVVAREAWEAEVLATAVVIGAKAGFDLLEGAAAVAVTTSGERLSAHCPPGLLR